MAARQRAAAAAVRRDRRLERLSRAALAALPQQRRRAAAGPHRGYEAYREPVVLPSAPLDGQPLQQQLPPGWPREVLGVPLCSLPGANHDRNAEVYAAFSAPPQWAAWPGVAGCGALTAMCEAHGAVCAGAFLSMQAAEGGPAPAAFPGCVVARSFHVAAARPAPVGKELVARAFVQHYHPLSEQVTVLCEIIDPTGDGGSPAAALRVVANYSALSAPHPSARQTEEGGHYSFVRPPAAPA
eukprot:TRINITY_DN37051_c0_g1_i1.p1 TRINITY_DN37051_c0_g1~~TRINITY_DN37051_c0_g1_i1.p1  ORF type:complete len:241 (+),score=52.75 TRINITY_DN37051_c0_g1_i1:92-814(+)